MKGKVHTQMLRKRESLVTDVEKDVVVWDRNSNKSQHSLEPKASTLQKL
jgi:hypothetical protein